MAAAALAYKCVEVAYMRVIYSSHNGANRDRHELQTALQMVPPGNSIKVTEYGVNTNIYMIAEILTYMHACGIVILESSIDSPSDIVQKFQI